jgi:hypothetical protein
MAAAAIPKGGLLCPVVRAIIRLRPRATGQSASLPIQLVMAVGIKHDRPFVSNTLFAPANLLPCQ